MKSSITHNEYLQLKGLAALGRKADKEISQAVRAMAELVDERDHRGELEKGGHMYEVATDYRELEDALRILGVTVEPAVPEKPPASVEYGFSDEERAAALSVIQAAKSHGWPEAAKLDVLEQALEP